MISISPIQTELNGMRKKACHFEGTNAEWDSKFVGYKSRSRRLCRYCVCIVYVFLCTVHEKVRHRRDVNWPCSMLTLFALCCACNTCRLYGFNVACLNTWMHALRVFHPFSHSIFMYSIMYCVLRTYLTIVNIVGGGCVSGLYWIGFVRMTLHIKPTGIYRYKVFTHVHTHARWEMVYKAHISKSCVRVARRADARAAAFIRRKTACFTAYDKNAFIWLRRKPKALCRWNHTKHIYYTQTHKDLSVHLCRADVLLYWFFFVWIVLPQIRISVRCTSRILKTSSFNTPISFAILLLFAFCCNALPNKLG